MHALVIGGTGPTGPFVINGLVERGWDVTVLHSGRHEVDTIPGHLPHIHTNAFDIGAVASALGGATFDAVFAMYGRLRDLAPYFAGRCGRFLSVGGVPVYAGFSHAAVWSPPGLPVPTREDAPLAGPDEQDKVVKMVQTEELVFEHHPTASHYRYPRIYGPGQVVPREWSVVKRVLDGRRRMIVADGGLTLLTAAFAENAAHILLLGLDHEAASAGQAFNVTDEHVLSAGQTIQAIAAGLDAEMELVSLPYSLATPAYPFIEKTPLHRVTSAEKIISSLGYRDRVGAVEALGQTARWLVDHPVEAGSVTEAGLGDPFNYAAEDALIAAWEDACAKVEPAAAAAETGFVDRYARDAVGAHLSLER
ncbi:MAG: NAD-dependent dehydratase [Acidimicrobiales bacterium]